MKKFLFSFISNKLNSFLEKKLFDNFKNGSAVGDHVYLSGIIKRLKKKIKKFFYSQIISIFFYIILEYLSYSNLKIIVSCGIFKNLKINQF